MLFAGFFIASLYWLFPATDVHDAPRYVFARRSTQNDVRGDAESHAAGQSQGNRGRSPGGELQPSA